MRFGLLLLILAVLTGRLNGAQFVPYEVVVFDDTAHIN